MTIKKYRALSSGETSSELDITESTLCNTFRMSLDELILKGLRLRLNPLQSLIETLANKECVTPQTIATCALQNLKQRKR